MIGRQLGDMIEGSRIACHFRKMNGPYLIAGTGSHKAQRAVIIGLPAQTWIEKPFTLAKK